jgi:biotin carboxyl carrier protein
MVPGKKMELNEGIRLLTGKSKIDIPLKKKTAEKPATTAPPITTASIPGITGPVTSKCTVDENGVRRTFTITVEPADGGGSSVPTTSAAPVGPPSSNGGTPVFSTFAGSVEVVDITVKIGDAVNKGQVVAAVEAMKAKHDIKSPVDGKVTSINVEIGDEIDSSKPIMLIG